MRQPFDIFLTATRGFSTATRLFALPLLCACLFFASPAAAEDFNDALTIPEGKDPLDSLRPPPDALDMSAAELPEAPPVKVNKRDKPRTEEPMEVYTEYFDRKVFPVPEARSGQTLTYFWKAPAAGSPKDKRYPLVVVLHDDKGVAQAAEHLIRKQMRKDFPSYLMIPVLPAGQQWAFPAKFPDEPKLEKNAKRKQALDDVVKLVESVQQENQIEPTRVYVIGCGEGGFGVFGAALRNGGVFAAGVPISGGWTIKEAPKMTKTPLFVLHGELDKTFAPGLSRNVAYWIQQSGGRLVSFVEIPGMDHDCANPMLYSKTMWQWMFRQQRKGVPGAQ